MKTISCRLQMIESARFMESLLSNLVDHLAEGIHGIKCTSCNTCCHKYTNAKDDLIECNRLCCNKNYRKKFDENVTKRFANTCKFANQDISKFILLLRKDVYPY